MCVDFSVRCALLRTVVEPEPNHSRGIAQAQPAVLSEVLKDASYLIRPSEEQVLIAPMR